MKDLKRIRATYQQIWKDGVTADIVLNCAGVQRRAEAIDFTDEDIDAVIDINVKATLVSCQEFAKKLIANGQPGKLSLSNKFQMANCANRSKCADSKNQARSSTSLPSSHSSVVRI